MIEYMYIYPNRKKSKRKPKKFWMESDYSDGGNNDVAFDKVVIRINGKIYTKRSDEFIDAWDKEHVWRQLSD